MILRLSAALLGAIALAAAPALTSADDAPGFQESFESSPEFGANQFAQQGESGGGYGFSGPEGGQGGGGGFGGQSGSQGGGGFGGQSGGQGGAGGAGGGASFARSGVMHLTLPSAPMVIITSEMSASTQKEWAEDLKVMDKLLRDAVMRVSGDARPPQAMGIRMTMFGGTVEPMYVEDCGAVFGLSVNATLAAASNEAEETNESPGDEQSAWERAKRDLQGGAAAGGLPPGFPGAAMPRMQPKKFKQSVVEDIVDAALKALPEAANLRHLADGEVVLVTIAGVNEAGTPVRLTLKAKKSDLDQAARGELSLKDFKARVARRVG